MSQITLITGGCRSGKSAHAVALAAARPGPTLFLATCDPGGDAEMQARVRAHRAERPDFWHLIESPLDPAADLRALAHGTDTLIFDCVPTWIANLLVRGDSDAAISAATADLVAACADCRARQGLVVSAEVGSGLVPETPLGRRFRDLTGLANQTLAAAAANVVCMIAGLALNIKGQP